MVDMAFESPNHVLLIYEIHLSDSLKCLSDFTYQKILTNHDYKVLKSYFNEENHLIN